jgi:cystathionine beta-lyase/cystathionine gamma-synthase
MTHAVIPKEKQMISGIDPRLIRLSLGIENPEDIIADLSRALTKI